MKIKVLILLTISMMFSSVLHADIFSDREKFIISCARERMQLFDSYFDKDTDRQSIAKTKTYKCTPKGGKASDVAIPKWIEPDMDEMSSRLVWQSKSQGVQSEADIWKEASGNIVDFLRISEEVFDTESQAGKPPVLLREKYAKARIRYLLSLIKLYNIKIRKQDGTYYTFYDSLDGRGRAVLASFDLIHQDMETVLASFTDATSNSERQEKYKQAIDSIALLSHNAFKSLSRLPLTESISVNEKKYYAPNILYFVLAVLGTLFIFFAVMFFITTEEKRIKDILDKRIKKTKEWTDYYDRQFLTLNVKYLVIIPLVLFSLFGVFVGMLSGGIFGLILFVFFTFIGYKVGTRMPGMLADSLKKRRGIKINGQLMDALILLSNSLKSGMDIVQGFELVSKDLEKPIAEEFGLVIKSYRLGTPFEQALEAMEDRVDSRLLSYMVKAVVLQRQVGGNLTKIFARIVENIREESKLEEKTQAMTAQQKIQALVVGIMPWIMLGVMFLFQTEQMLNFYLTLTGFIVLMFAMLWIFIGMKMVKKLGEIKV